MEVLVRKVKVEKLNSTLWVLSATLVSTTAGYTPGTGLLSNVWTLVTAGLQGSLKVADGSPSASVLVQSYERSGTRCGLAEGIEVPAKGACIKTCRSFCCKTEIDDSRRSQQVYIVGAY